MKLCNAYPHPTDRLNQIRQHLEAASQQQKEVVAFWRARYDETHDDVVHRACIMQLRL